MSDQIKCSYCGDAVKPKDVEYKSIFKNGRRTAELPYHKRGTQPKYQYACADMAQWSAEG